MKLSFQSTAIARFRKALIPVLAGLALLVPAALVPAADGTPTQNPWQDAFEDIMHSLSSGIECPIDDEYRSTPEKWMVWAGIYYRDCGFKIDLTDPDKQDLKIIVADAFSVAGDAPSSVNTRAASDFRKLAKEMYIDLGGDASDLDP